MTTTVNHRSLPAVVLDGRNNPNHDEAISIVAKYSNPNARLDGGMVDVYALAFMNIEAKLFWIPRFIDYVQHEAAVDSVLTEVLLMRLSQEGARALRKAATPEEVVVMRDYLKWYGTTGMIDGLHCRKKMHKRALNLWK